jgi:hypothetical protein
MASATTVFSFGSYTVISQPILKCKPIFWATLGAIVLGTTSLT